MSHLIFKLNVIAGVLLSATAFAQTDGVNAQSAQHPLLDVAQTTSKHTVKRQLLQAGRNAQPGAYVAEMKVGAPGMASITPVFSQIRLPARAYIEVSDPSQEEVYLYGHKDFGQLADGEWFASLSISGEYARIRVVYPEGAVPGVDDSVVLEHWESPPSNLGRNISSYAIVGDKDERELTPCVLAKKPAWTPASLATAYMSMTGTMGTAWALGNSNFMVTNNHVVSTQESLSQKGEARFQYVTPGCQHAAPGHVLKIKPEKLLVTGNGTKPHDYSLFTLDPFDYEHAKVKTLFGGLELVTKNPALNTPLYIPQHGSIAGPSGSRHYQSIGYVKGNASCKVTAVNNELAYNCDTMGGASGSAVLSQDSGKVVGVHWGKRSNGNRVTNHAVTAETLWQAIQPYVDKKQNQAVAGQGKLNLAQVSISKEQTPALGQRFSDQLSFEAFSGRWLTHEKTYSTIAAASQDIQSGDRYEIVYRVSQNVNGQHYNLQQLIAGSKTLNVSYVASDNPSLSHKGPHKSWLGLKAKAANGALVNHYLVKVNNTIPGNENGDGGPSAEIVGPAEIVQGGAGAILSAAASTGDKLKYQWHNDSRLMLLTNNDKVIVNASKDTALGTHLVKLTVTDSKDRIATAVHAFEVKADEGHAPPQAKISGEATVKAGGTLTLSAENSIGNELKYLWSNGHGLTFQPGNNARKVDVVVPAGAQAGQVYSFKLAVTDYLNRKHEASHEVTVKKDVNGNAPVARISGGQASYISGKSIRLDGGGSSGYNGALSYQWTASPALNMGNAAASAVSFTAPDVKKETAYQVALTVKDRENGKEHRVSHKMTIKPKEDGGKPPTGDNWDAAMVYRTPCTKVIYKGKEWMNGWEVKGVAPGSDGLWGAWRERGASNMHSACKGK